MGARAPPGSTATEHPGALTPPSSTATTPAAVAAVPGTSGSTAPPRFSPAPSPPRWDHGALLEAPYREALTAAQCPPLMRVVFPRSVIGAGLRQRTQAA